MSKAKDMGVIAGNGKSLVNRFIINTEFDSSDVAELHSFFEGHKELARCWGVERTSSIAFALYKPELDSMPNAETDLVLLSSRHNEIMCFVRVVNKSDSSGNIAESEVFDLADVVAYLKGRGIDRVGWGGRKRVG